MNGGEIFDRAFALIASLEDAASSVRFMLDDMNAVCIADSVEALSDSNRAFFEKVAGASGSAAHTRKREDLTSAGLE